MAHAKEILDAVLKLEPAERARIAHEIIVSLDEEPADEGVEEAWEQELERRARDIDEGRVQFVSWSEARQEIEGSRRKGG
jgi:putative addiction module component (TIGR02574 family)